MFVMRQSSNGPLSNYPVRRYCLSSINPGFAITKAAQSSPTLFKCHLSSSCLLVWQRNQRKFSNYRSSCLFVNRGQSINSNQFSSPSSLSYRCKSTSSHDQGKSSGEVSTKSKRSLGKKIKDELVHYYHGFRLLIIDIRISIRLLWRLLRRYELSRREHEQLVRTTADLFRLVPFSVFIIVPFMELLLPFFVKLFPGMLPSTFQTKSDKESKIKRQLKVKLEMAKFLQDTLQEMSFKASGESHSEKAKEFAEFFETVRKSGEQASNVDILKFSKIFEDEITLDSLNRSQLTALCRLLELQPIGTNNFLRFQLRMKLRSLKADDKMIMKEGISTLTIPELQQACRARGMRALGLPEERLRNQLKQWLELSLNEQIPPSLLLLSRVLYLPENLPATDQLKATIQALPEEAVTEAKYKIGESEGKVDNKTKIELIRQEEEAIRREQEEEEAAKREELAKQEKLVDKAPVIDFDSTSVRDAEDDIDEKKELSREDIESLETVIESKGIAIEKEELKDLQEEMEEYKEDIKEISVEEAAKALRVSKGAKRLGKRVDKMIGKMEHLVKDLESKRESLQQGIDTMEEKGEKLEAIKEEFVNVEEILDAARKITTVDDKTKLKKIMKVLEMMDVDHDGKIEVDQIVKVLELVGHENIKLTPQQMKDIIKLVMQEEQIEDEEKKVKASKEMGKSSPTSPSL